MAIPFAPGPPLGKARWHVCPPLLVRPRPRPRRPVGRQSPLQALPQAHRMVPAATSDSTWKRRDHSRRAPSHHAASAYPVLGLPGRRRSSASTARANTPPPSSATGRMGASTRSRKFYDPDSWAASTARSRVPRIRDARRRIQGDGHGAYGDPTRHDFPRLARFENGELIVNTDYANVIGLRRYKEKGGYVLRRS